MGAKNPVIEAPSPWLTPLALWTGILAGPLAWSCDLLVSYALVHRVCASGRSLLLFGVTAAALIAIAGGTVVSLLSLAATSGRRLADGADVMDRARFMAILGLATNALFAAAVVAQAIPRWVLDACH